MSIETNNPFPEPFELSWSDKFLLKTGGLKPALVEKFGSSTDVTALRNRGAAELALFFYTGSVISIGAESLFGTAGSIGLPNLGIGFGLAYLFLRMDAFLHVRGLFHAGKREVVKAGARLGFGSDDVAWYSALAARTLVGVSQAVVVGTIASQILFGFEINAHLNKISAERNATVIAAHTAIFADRLKAQRETAKHDEDDAAGLKKNAAALRTQDIANSRLAARQSARQQVRPGIEKAQAMTSAALQGYENKSAAADKKAQESGKAYTDMLAVRGEVLRTAIENDPRFLPEPRGLLARLSALRAISHEDGFVAVGIVLVDLVGIGIELWILILSVAQCPTRLSVALYCEHMKSTSAAARELIAAIKQPVPERTHEPQVSGNEGDDRLSESPPIVGGAGDTGSSFPPRRPRGRPRKNLVEHLPNGGSPNV
jgi:hypothetical protein